MLESGGITIAYSNHKAKSGNDNGVCRANQADAFTRLVDIIETLRGPGGCPWDKKQTPTSLAPNLIEETYEFIDALRNEDPSNMEEELGDLYLLVTMISYMKQQENSFSISDVLHHISDKLVRRHPHVFGNEEKENPDEVIELWNSIKQNQENKKSVRSITEEIPRTLPPLERAYKLQKKVAKIGFDWNDSRDVENKVVEELKELIDVIESKDRGTAPQHEQRLESELGDILFSMVNLSRYLDIDPAVALHKTNSKFVERFHYIEEAMGREEKELSSENFDRMEELWNEAKEQEQHGRRD